MNASSPRLTIVLPLKGRHLFTLRFLWHANMTRLPYRFLIADGQVHPTLAGLLENSRDIFFPNLDIDYVRFPDDANFSCFFQKMSGALARVTTSYAMIADNDDFLAGSGIDQSLEFLDAHRDYICCGGGLAGFSVYSGVGVLNSGLIGQLNRFEYRYTVYDRSADYGSASVENRLREGSRNWWSYYAVFRTEALATIWREVVDIDFSDLQIFEFYCAMRTLTMGKAKSDPSTIAYLRQYGTSQRSSFKKDWVHHLLRSRFSSDFNTMVDRIAVIAASADRVNSAAVAEMLRSICEEWLREFLRVNYGSLQSLKQILRDYAPSLVTWLKERRRYFVRWERAALLSKLRAGGASATYVAQFERELAQMEEVISGRTFADFVSPYVGQLGIPYPAVTVPMETPAGKTKGRQCA